MEPVPEIIWSMQSRLWNYAGLRDERRPFRDELISNWTFRDEIISNQIATKIRQEVRQMWREQLGKVSVWNFDVLLDRKMRKMSGITFFWFKECTLAQPGLTNCSIIRQTAANSNHRSNEQRDGRTIRLQRRKLRILLIPKLVLWGWKLHSGDLERNIPWDLALLLENSGSLQLGFCSCSLECMLYCILLAAFMLLYLVPFNNTRISMIAILSKF